MLFPMRYPHRYGAGLIPKHVWDWWLDEITNILKGGTDFGIVEGWWLREWDRNRMVFAIVEEREMEATLQQVRDFLEEAAVEFKQEAMYLEYSAVHYEEVRAQKAG